MDGQPLPGSTVCRPGSSPFPTTRRPARSSPHLGVCHPRTRPPVGPALAARALARGIGDTGQTGTVAIALVGQHLATADRLAEAAGRVRTVADLDRLAASLPGSFHLAASVDGRVRVQGTVTGVRRVFHAQVGGVAMAADRADVLAGLLDAGVDEQRLALHLLEPHILYPLAGQPVWRGVELLATDHYLVLDGDGRRRSVRWWSPPGAGGTHGRGRARAAGGAVGGGRHPGARARAGQLRPGWGRLDLGVLPGRPRGRQGRRLHRGHQGPARRRRRLGRPHGGRAGHRRAPRHPGRAGAAGVPQPSGPGRAAGRAVQRHHRARTVARRSPGGPPPGARDCT